MKATASRPEATRPESDNPKVPNGWLSALMGLSQQPAPVILALLFVVVAVMRPAFFGGANITAILQQAAILGLVTIGQTFVLLGRGLDLSVGAVMGLSATIVTKFAANGMAFGLAVLVAFGVSAAVGALNAWLVVRRSVAPFIATLGTYILVEGLRTAYTQGSTTGVAPRALRHVALGSLGAVPTALLIWAAVTVVALGILHRTAVGRFLYASGGNPQAARLSGVPVTTVLAASYVVAALLACCAGLLQAGYTGYVDQYLGNQVQLTSITAALIGGVTFAGGKGGMLGPVAGALLLTALANLVALLNLSSADQSIVTGAVLLLAVALQGLRLALQSGRVALRDLLPPFRGG